MRYPIEWRGETYTLGELAVKVKEDYVAWFRLHLLTGYTRDLPVGPAQANAIRELESDPPWWTDGLCSPDVHGSFGSKAGSIKLHRLLLCDKGNVLSDADIYEMIREKQKDPQSDYMVAMKLVRGDADPPANGSGSSQDRTAAKSSGPAS